MTTADMESIEAGLRTVESDLCDLLDSGRATPVEWLLVQPILASVASLRGQVAEIMRAVGQGGGE